jgi:NAD(P)-dependent dehydrogenase (short-subunit alcohol dehydrogenase family)
LALDDGTRQQGPRRRDRGGPLSLIDTLLDASVFWSFDASGFARHARTFRPDDLAVDLAGAPVIVTGANSGIGFEVANAVARAGAEVWMVCRNRERGERARDALATHARVSPRLEVLDVADLDALRDFARRAPERIHALVHSAGALDPVLTRSSQGLEQTFATHVAGPHLLTRALGARSARVVFVSSGGMYTQRLDVDATVSPPEPYDGVVAYARCKRAQVVLTELWAARLPGTVVHAMHPGWAATPGVSRSLPAFDRWMKGRLRTAAQGADTVTWLTLADTPTHVSGRFWFDRREVSPYLLPGTREPAGERTRLWETLERVTG